MFLLRIRPAIWQPFLLDLKESFSKNPPVVFQQAQGLSLVLTTLLHYLPCYNCICFVVCCHNGFQNEVFSLATSAEKRVAKIDILTFQAFFIIFPCNEAINICKERLHYFGTVLWQRVLHAMCFKQHVKQQMWGLQYWIPSKI